MFRDFGLVHISNGREQVRRTVLPTVARGPVNSKMIITRDGEHCCVPSALGHAKSSIVAKLSGSQRDNGLVVSRKRIANKEVPYSGYYPSPSIAP